MRSRMLVLYAFYISLVLYTYQILNIHIKYLLWHTYQTHTYSPICIKCTLIVVYASSTHYGIHIKYLLYASNTHYGIQCILYISNTYFGIQCILCISNTHYGIHFKYALYVSNAYLLLHTYCCIRIKRSLIVHYSLHLLPIFLRSLQTPLQRYTLQSSFIPLFFHSFIPSFF